MMDGFRSSKISARIFLSFLVILVLFVVSSAMSLSSIHRVDTSYSIVLDNVSLQLVQLKTLRGKYANIDKKLQQADFTSKEQAINILQNAYDELDKLEDETRGYKTLINSEATGDLVGDKGILYFEQLLSLITENKNDLQQLMLRDMTNIDLEISLHSQKYWEKTNTLLDLMSENSLINLHNVSAKNTEISNRMIEKTAVAVIIGILFCILFSFLMSKSILKPVNILIEATKQISKGNLDMDLKTKAKDEIGILSNQFATVVGVINDLVRDMEGMAKQQKDGDFEAFLDAKKYDGDFFIVADGINKMVKNNIDETLLILDTVTKYGNGDFTAKLAPFPGKKMVANEVIEKLRLNLNEINKDIMNLATASGNGNFKNLIDNTKYEGDWAKISNKLNELLEAIAQPLQESVEILNEISKGNLKSTMQGTYKGDFLLVEKAVNTTVLRLNEMISNVTDTLTKMANDDFTVEITNDYPGDFAPIQTALNKIIRRINEILQEINSTATQVAIGSKQISESAICLAHGATEQAGSIQELTETIMLINEHAIASAKTADSANQLAATTYADAKAGNHDMADMLAAMTEISNSSNEISKIIKVIEEIASQTNLLSLNASVEAARAGQQGKGFAVVASEVRQLAIRCKTAAQQTAELIVSTVSKVDVGMKITNQTATGLEKIVASVSEISDLVSEIAVSSSDQAKSIGQINSGVSQISDVTQSNTSTSQETAAASEELSSQSETFKNMVNSFKLKA